jgi:uncharacterized protein (TIGR03437 family)
LTTHRILLREGSTYTAFEVNNAPPYDIVHTTPHFDTELNACAPASSGIYSFNVIAAGQTPTGGYILAFNAAPTPDNYIAVFDPNLHLIGETPVTVSPLAFADLNGDGNPDMVGSTFIQDGYPALAIALGTGGATFATPVLYPLPQESFTSIAAVVVADVNGDHKPDILALFEPPGSAGILVFLGKGDGTFQAPFGALSTSSPVAMQTFAVADLNRDGKPDLVFTAMDDSGPGAVVEVALGVGDGTFGKPVEYAAADTAAVAIGDLNGDGIPDIVTTGITILFGDGKGGFPTRRDTLLEAQGNLIVTDFNGDGIADVVVATGNAAILAGDTVTVLFGVGKGVFDGPPVSVVAGSPAATGDVNGDGFPDLAVLDFEGPVSVLKGAGDGTFQSTFQYDFSAGLPYAAVFADFNHDGKLDLAIGGSGYTPTSTGEVDILLGNGDGTFQPPLKIPAPLGAFNLAAADFNADGNVDLAVLVSQEGGGPSDSVLMLLGRGDGTFTAGDSYAVGPFAHSFVTGDFNGDGKLDLIVTDAGTYAGKNQNGNLTLLAGKGDGSFATPAIIPVTGGFVRGPYNIFAADFNRDGNLDLAVTLSDYSNYEGGLLTLLGHGDGTFAPPVIYANNAVTVQAGDLNGDGIPDLVVTGTTVTPGPSYLLGNGDGSFQPAELISSGYLGPLLLADFNRDGKLDVAGGASSGVAAFLNTSTPPPPVTVVSAAALSPGPIAPESLATAFGMNFATPALVSIEDSTGATFEGAVVYSSASQINFVIPAGLDAGPATVTVGRQTASVLITPVAPRLFTLNEPGLAAAYVTRVAAGGEVSNQPIATLQNGVYIPIPIDVTAGTAYLILFGTGLRNGSNLEASVNSTSAAVEYLGPQPSVAGLDQVNLLLPVSLAGSGCANVTLTNGPFGIASNTVYVCFK